MKKLFYFAAAAVALAACAKNEVIPVNSGENQEITFNVAPKMKADPQTQPGEFSTDNVFASWAYYLPENKNWIADSKEAKEYISGAEILYNTTDKVWKAKQSYYWPKDGGKLTFFAYSLNKGNLTLKGSNSAFSCGASSEGIHGGIQGHIDLMDNPNTDFLVADIAIDKTSNEKAYSMNGVPTLFKHKLSSVVFAIKTGADYTNKKFELTNITFHNLSHYGVYGQLPKELFSASGTKYNPVFTSAAQEIKTDFVGVIGVDNDIFIPQIFKQGSNADENAYIEVKYTITTTVSVTTPAGTSTKEVVEEVTKNIFLYPATGTPMFEKWEMGKKYTINLTFTLNEIHWAPAVQDWEDVNIGTGINTDKPIIVG